MHLVARPQHHLLYHTRCTLLPGLNTISSTTQDAPCCPAARAAAKAARPQIHLPYLASKPPPPPGLNTNSSRKLHPAALLHKLQLVAWRVLPLLLLPTCTARPAQAAHASNHTCKAPVAPRPHPTRRLQTGGCHTAGAAGPPRCCRLLPRRLHLSRMPLQPLPNHSRPAKLKVKLRKHPTRKLLTQPGDCFKPISKLEQGCA